MSQETKTPFLRLARRDGMEGWKSWCVRAGSIAAALLLGAVNYLRKPCPPQELRKRVAQELEKR